MSEHSQLPLPASFIALYVPPGRHKPTASRQEMAERYEACEDLATALTERAATLLWELGVTEDDVLARVHRGLLQEGAGLSPAEAGWVTCRLAELLDWALPRLTPPPPAD